MKKNHPEIEIVNQMIKKINQHGYINTVKLVSHLLAVFLIFN